MALELGAVGILQTVRSMEYVQRMVTYNAWLGLHFFFFFFGTQREVYQLVTKPQHFKPVKCKWVYTIKLTPSGAIDRFKARLVAKGFTQVYQRDYFDTYSPVIDIMSFFYMFAWAIARNYNIIQVDVKTAFLYGDLDEEIYMTQPEGFVCICVMAHIY